MNELIVACSKVVTVEVARIKTTPGISILKYSQQGFPNGLDIEHERRRPVNDFY